MYIYLRVYIHNRKGKALIYEYFDMLYRISANGSCHRKLYYRSF